MDHFEMHYLQKYTEIGILLKLIDIMNTTNKVFVELMMVLQSNHSVHAGIT